MEESMETQTPSRQTGRKIWYATAIALSVLVLLISVASVVGAWVVQNTLSDVTVSLLQTVYDSAGGLRQVIQKVDQGFGEVRQITSEVSQISTQISQNVDDKGLLLLLLPQEKEDKLVEGINSIQETLNTIREFLATFMEMYRAIDKLPFVNLPKPSIEQVEKIEAALTRIQTDIAALRKNVQDFRAGAADVISRVTQAADKITAGIDELSGWMSNLDSDLLALQEFALRMQTTIPRVLFVIAVVATLFLAWVIYTQVEAIRLYVRRWKLLSEPQAALPEPESTPEQEQPVSD
jgi:hypothetical protein